MEQAEFKKKGQVQEYSVFKAIVSTFMKNMKHERGGAEALCGAVILEHLHEKFGGGIRRADF